MKTEDRDQQASYPVYDLSEAIKVAAAVKDLGGSRAGVERELLGQHLKLAVGGPSFFQRVSAARAFGMIEGRGTYSLTDRARRFFWPTDENDQFNASVEILSNPPSFAVLVHRYSGQKLPSNEILGNVLHGQANIPLSKKDVLASIFVRSANLLKLIDQSGVLSITTSSQPVAPGQNGNTEVTVSKVNATKTVDPLSVPASLVGVDDAPPGNTVWSYSHKGKVIRVQTPEDISSELWQKLEAYVKILKPEA